MFFKDFTQFIKYYGKGQKIKLFGFLILSVIAGLLEFCGITLISPFILLIVNPQIIVSNPYYIRFTDISHLHNVMLIALILGFIVMLVFVFKNLFLILTLYIQNKFINNWKNDLSKKFMHYYLFSSYKDSLKVQASEKIYNLTFLIQQTLECFVFRMINLIINATIIFMILILLFTKFLFAAIVTSIFVFCSMSLQSKFFKNKFTGIAERFHKSSVLNNEKTLENINTLKDIKILSAEDYFYKDYAVTQKEFTDSVATNNFFNGISIYIVEILVILSLFILAGIVSLQNINDTSWMIASYAVLVAAIFRLAGPLNRIQNAINGINISSNFVKTMNSEYKKIDLDYEEDKMDVKFTFNDSIKLKNINFSYKKDPVIRNLDLEIKKGEFVGIIGLSGAGKSTLADIIMGLLPASSGEIYVDNFKFNKQNYTSLRKIIGYVPQQISILNTTFRKNVAWGIPEEEIDDERVREVLKNSQLYHFVTSFGNGINEKINSNSLSQGQKQRLAIARALYRESQILIFDEATSSLDVETEFEITNMLNGLKGEKTIIAIAHRLSTLKSCDRLIYLKDGKLVDTGTFEELKNKYADFEKLIKLSNINI